MLPDFEDRGNRIYQLTSSPITYNMSRIQSWMLRLGAADDGLTDDGHRFRRLALYAEESYILVSVDPAKGEAWFKLWRNSRAWSSQRIRPATCDP